MRNTTSDGTCDVAVIGLGAMVSAALLHLARRRLSDRAVTWC